MRRRWGIGAGAAGLLLVLLSWLLWRPATAPESGSRATGHPVSAQTGAPVSRSLWSLTTPAESRGTRSIQGRVVGPHGPVPGALVVALAPASREWPSLLPLWSGRPPGWGSSCDMLLAATPLLEMAAELRGKQPPLARVTTDAQGIFRLEGLEAGTLTLWAEGAEGVGLRGQVAVGSEQVEVRLGPGMTFSGVVRDDLGRPAAGALVTTLQRDAGRFVEASTNEEGRFLLGPLPWGRYDVLVSKAGLVPARLESSDLVRGPVQVLLPTPGRISGEVVDERGPVPGATVQLEGGSRGEPVSTDLRGRFRLQVPCQGRYVLTASHGARYARHEVSLEAGLDKEAVTLLLGPSLRLSGQVTGTSGQPLEGAAVSLFGAAEQWVGSALTDSRGGFVFERLPPGTYTTLVQADAHERLEVPPRRLSVSQELRFTLKEAERRTAKAEEASLELEWVDAAERPVSEAQVKVSSNVSGVHLVTTGLDGRAVLQGLAPGGYHLEPFPREGWLRHAPLRVELRGSESRKVRLQSEEEGWSLSGQVVDAEGRPLEGALLIASGEAEPETLPENASLGRLRSETAQGLSGPGGRFTLANLPEGPCSLEVILRGYGLDAGASRGLEQGAHFAQDVGVSPGSPDVRIVLRSRPRAHGRVVREDGGPITSFRVNHDVVSHPEGRFSVPVAHGWTLYFSAPGFSHVRRKLAERGDGDVELGDVVLVADRTVRGRVLEAGTSAPVAGARVQVSPSHSGARGGSPQARDVQVAYSLPDGSFTVEGVKAGGGVVRVTHPDWPPVRMALEEGQREVTVGLVRGATLEGRIEAAGAPVRSGSVRLRSEQGELMATMGFWDGRYALRAIPAGRYLVQVMARPGEEGPAPMFPVRQVELSAGGSVTLDFTGESEGVAVEVLVAEPDIEVHLIPGNLPLMGPKQGLYSRLSSGHMGRPVREGVRGFPRLSAGSYTLFAMRRGEDIIEVHREELELPTGGELTFSLLPQWSLYDD